MNLSLEVSSVGDGLLPHHPRQDLQWSPVSLTGSTVYLTCRRVKLTSATMVRPAGLLVLATLCLLGILWVLATLWSMIGASSKWAMTGSSALWVEHCGSAGGRRVDGPHQVEAGKVAWMDGLNCGNILIHHQLQWEKDLKLELRICHVMIRYARFRKHIYPDLEVTLTSVTKPKVPPVIAKTSHRQGHH